MYNKINIYFAALFVILLIIINNPIRKIFKSVQSHWNWVFVLFIIGSIISFTANSYETNMLYPFDDKFITVTGYVSEIPRENNDRYSYIINVDEAHYTDMLIKAKEKVLLSTDVRLNYMQNVTVRGFLKRIDGKNNRSDFDYNLYYKSKDVYYKISDYEVISSGERKSYTPQYYVNRIKLKMAEVADKYFKGENAAFIKAVTTGNRREFSDEFSDKLQRTGIMRMLYPGYLHILMIVCFLNFVLSFLRRQTRDNFIICALILYAIFNFSSMVLLKSAMLAIFTIFASKKFGYAHYPDLLSLVVIFILLINPLMVYNQGFIISVIMGWLFFSLKDPLKEALSFIKGKRLRFFVVFSLITTVGISPVLAYCYNGMGIYSPVINYIFLPVVAITVVLCIILNFELTVFGMSFLARPVIDFILTGMEKATHIIDSLPYAFINLKRPSLLFIFTFYLLVVLIRFLYVRGWKDITTKLIAVTILGLSTSMIGYSLYMNSALKVSFVNVGQADAAIIRIPYGEKILVDGGGSEEYSDYNVGEEVFLPYLKSEGLFKIDIAIVSHYHKDHCEGIIAAMENLNVKNVMMPAVYPNNEYRVKIEDIARKTGANIYYLKSGDKIELKSGAIIEVIAPYPVNPEEENDSSVVFRFTYKDFDALFTGDITGNIENEFINSFADVELLKVAHHGSDSSTTKAFLEKVKPEIAVISVGEDNTYGFPDDEVIKRLENINAKIYRTDESGDITFAIFNNDKILVNCFYRDSNNNEWRKENG